MRGTKVRPGLLWRRHIKKLGPLETSFAGRYRGLMRELRAGARNTSQPFNLEKWQDRVAEGMRPEYVRAIVHGGRDFLGTTLTVRKAILGGWVTKARRGRAADVVSDLESSFSDRIRETVQTTWDSLVNVIDEAEADDLDANEIDDLVDEEWDDVLGDRSDEIAATEVNGAVNSVRDYLMKQLVELQQWVNSADERVRLTHRIYGEAGEKPVGFDYAQLADDAGYSIRYPCDPECHEPAEIVNCRCFMVPAGELEFDEEELADYLSDFEMDPEDLMRADDQESVYVPNAYGGKGFEAKDWNEADHPRDERGRFGDGSLEAFRETPEWRELRDHLGGNTYDDNPADAGGDREAFVSAFKPDEQSEYDHYEAWLEAQGKKPPKRRRKKSFDPDQPRDEYGRWVDIFGNTVEERAPDHAQTDDPSAPNYAWADTDEPGSKPPLSPRMLDEVYEKKDAAVEARATEISTTKREELLAKRDEAAAKAGDKKREIAAITEKQAALEAAADPLRDIARSAVAAEFEKDRIEVAQARARIETLGGNGGHQYPAVEADHPNAEEINSLRDRILELDKKWEGQIGNGEPPPSTDWLAPSSGEYASPEGLREDAADVLATGTFVNSNQNVVRVNDPAAREAIAAYRNALAEAADVRMSLGIPTAEMNKYAYQAQQFDSQAMNAHENATMQAIAEQGVDFSYERAMRLDSVHEENMATIGRSWAHIGGEGPITLRYAAEMGLGLEKGAAFDSKLGRFVTDLEKDYPGATDKATVLAGSIRREYEESQQEIADGIDFTLHGGDDEEIDYDALNDMQAEAFSNLSNSDKVSEYIEGDKKLRVEALNWGLENEEEVVRYAKDNSSDDPPEPWRYVDTKTAREIVPEEAKTIVDSLNRYLYGRDDDGDYSDLETSYKKLDRNVDAARALDRRFRDTRDTREEPTASDMRDVLDRAQRMSDAVLSKEDSPFLERIKEAADLVEAGKLDDARPLIDSINVDFRQWGERTLKDFKSDVIPGINPSSLQDANESAYESWGEAHREWLDPYYLEAYADADPDSKIREAFDNAYQPDELPMLGGSGAEDISIGADEWPLKMHRTLTLSEDAKQNYTPNYMESWAYNKQDFGRDHLVESIDPARVLVFQGAKNWKTPKGQSSMGNRENEFIVLSDVPKFVKEARERYEKVKSGQVKLREAPGKIAQREALVQRFRDLRRMQNYGGWGNFDNLRDQIEAQASAMGLEWDDLVRMARD